MDLQVGSCAKGSLRGQVWKSPPIVLHFGLSARHTFLLCWFLAPFILPVSPRSTYFPQELLNSLGLKSNSSRTLPTERCPNHVRTVCLTSASLRKHPSLLSSKQTSSLTQSDLCAQKIDVGSKYSERTPRVRCLAATPKKRTAERSPTRSRPRSMSRWRAPRAAKRLARCLDDRALGAGSRLTPL